MSVLVVINDWKVLDKVKFLHHVFQKNFILTAIDESNALGKIKSGICGCCMLVISPGNISFGLKSC